MAQRIRTAEWQPDTLVVIPDKPGWGRRIARTLGLLALVLLVLAGLILGGAVVARNVYNDDTVPVIDSLVNPDGPQSLIAVFAFPGDEIAAAGTLARLDQQGVRTTVVFYADTAPDAEDSGANRFQAEAATEALGVDEVIFLDRPVDSLQPDVALGLSRTVMPILAANPPAAVLTMDDEVGYNGSPARRAVADATRLAVTRGNAGQWADDFGLVPEDEAPTVAGNIALWQAVLAQPQLDWAVDNAAAFRGDFPVFDLSEAPTPDAAISITEATGAKAAAVAEYSMGVPAVQVLPYSELVPPELYYRVLDREYFREVQFSSLPSD